MNVNTWKCCKMVHQTHIDCLERRRLNNFKAYNYKYLKNTMDLI
jgi:hypothetical protein